MLIDLSKNDVKCGKFMLHEFDLFCNKNKGEFRSRPISAFVYIFVLNQSGCWKAKIVNKTSEKILPSSRALVQVNFNFFDLKPKYYDRTH